MALLVIDDNAICKWSFVKTRAEITFLHPCVDVDHFTMQLEVYGRTYHRVDNEDWIDIETGDIVTLAMPTPKE